MLVVGQFGVKSERVSTKWILWIELYIVWHYDCCILADLERHHRIDCCGCKQRLPWCWTEEAAHWISQELRLLVFHTAVWFCVLHCCSSLFAEDRCLLTLKALQNDNAWSLVPTMCCCRTSVLQNQHQVFCNCNDGKDAKCLTAYIVQKDTARVCPAINWVIRVFRREFRKTWKLILNNSTGTADLCLRWQSTSIHIR